MKKLSRVIWLSVISAALFSCTQKNGGSDTVSEPIPRKLLDIERKICKNQENEILNPSEVNELCNCMYDKIEERITFSEYLEFAKIHQSFENEAERGMTMLEDPKFRRIFLECLPSESSSFG